ncbi:LytTR family transcriptional regulator [Listeria booriae]|uniref:LytTR family transcriptional regulator n=1 Tax=Listeria booriae TaxID=1552123 RepID=A0A842FFC8_9LIST|nr:LytTR family DNA-binding domain-containing protein [Listeria booriae]MBC2243412.1 LytTR family transcriptional regulator [Listeria booriae]
MRIFIVEKQLVQITKEVIDAHQYPFDIHLVTEPAAILRDIGELPNIYFLTADSADIAWQIRELDVHGYLIFFTNCAGALHDIVGQYIAPTAYIVRQEEISRSRDDIAFALQSVFSREMLRQNTNCFVFDKENRVAYEDILYFETIPRTRKVMLHTRNGTYIIADFLKNIKTGLASHAEFSGVNSYLINLNNVTRIDRKNGIIAFKGDAQIHAGRRVITTVYKDFQSQFLH